MVAVARVGVELDSRGAINGLRGLDAQAKKTQGAFNGLQKAALQVATAAAAIQGAKFVFAKTAELETQTRSLKVLTGSLQDAQKVVRQLQDFGAVTPFTSSELIETAKRLKAFGFETEKIVDVTKRLGDIAGATGADLGGIATAFGQIQAKGRLQGEELLQLQERGVDLQGTLRKEYGLTADEFQKALSKGQIGADAVNFALEKLTNTGGKYADGAIAQSDTLSGKFSTLQDGIDTVARTIGEVLSPAIKVILNEAIDAINIINRLIGNAQRAQKFGLDKTQQKKILNQAQKEAEEIINLRNIANPFERNKAFQQMVAEREKDLLNKFGFETGQLQPEINRVTGATKIPELSGGTVPTGGTGGTGGTGKERIDMTKELFGLNQRLRQELEAGNEREAATLELMIRRQEIAESSLLPVEKENELQAALFKFRGEIFDLDKQIAEQRKKDQADADKAIQDRLKKEEELARKRREADPAFQMKKQLEELLDIQNQVAAGATVIGNAFGSAFKSVINGSKSAEDALKDMLAATAEHFLDMAAQIIAQQLAMILYGTIMKALGISGGGNMGGDNFFDPLTGKGVAGPNFGLAEGGYVSSPTNALIGEGGEPEYVIPESKMRTAMSRYSRGSRGGSVIAESGAVEATEGGGGTTVAAPIDVRYTVERINSVDYVTADQFQVGMQQAAQQGAKQGEQQTLKRLQMSGSTRKRIGI